MYLVADGNCLSIGAPTDVDVLSLGVDCVRGFTRCREGRKENSVNVQALPPQCLVP